MDTNNDSPNPIQEPEWQEAVEEEYSKEQVQVLRAADASEQEEQAQEEEYTPDWDGTDASFIEDADAAEYEEQYTGIKLSYSLTQQEAMACLKHARLYKTAGKRALLESVLLGIAGALFFVSFGFYGGAHNLVLGILSLLLIPVLWLVPYFYLSARAKEIAGGSKTEVEIYPDEVVASSQEVRHVISLDGTSRYEEFDDLMTLITPQGAFFAIPMRAIEPAVIADIQGMLIAGCAGEKS